MNALHGEWTASLLLAWLAPFRADCRRELAMIRFERETEPAAPFEPGYHITDEEAEMILQDALRKDAERYPQPELHAMRPMTRWERFKRWARGV